MSIDAQVVKTLRERTGAGMMDCKKALLETNGDLEKAVDHLRKTGIAKAEKKGQRSTKEGLVFSYIHQGGKLGVLLEINCETDFVAKTEGFNELAQNISMQIAATNPASISREDMDPSILDREKNIFTEQAKDSGKPENITGVLHVKALLRAIEENADRDLSGLNIQDIATEPFFVPETTPLFAQLQAFRARREHFAVVIDEYGDLRGIVTLEDILEEIVGDIDDETDIDLPDVKQQPDGSFITEGTVTLRDLNRLLALELPDDEASTLAGLIIYESQHIPSVGQEFKFHDIRFKIIARQNNQITSIRFWLPTKQPPMNVKGNI